MWVLPNLAGLMRDLQSDSLKGCMTLLLQCRRQTSVLLQFVQIQIRKQFCINLYLCILCAIVRKKTVHENILKYAQVTTLKYVFNRIISIYLLTQKFQESEYSFQCIMYCVLYANQLNWGQINLYLHFIRKKNQKLLEISLPCNQHLNV